MVAVSVFPDGFDPRAEVAGLIDLVEIDAVSGIARFIIGHDGVFRDALGREWYGSQVIGCTGYDWSRGSSADEGALTMSYFQDPAAGSLIEDLRASGDAEIAGRAVRFYLQPILSMPDFHAPRVPPVLIASKWARAIGFAAEGDTVRQLTLHFEGAMQNRRRRRGFFYTVSDHNRVLGSPEPPNPSLEFVPIDGRTDEPLFG